MSTRFIAAIPKLASLDIERSIAFFAGLGFLRGGVYPGYGIVHRDGVEIHFWLCTDAAIPQATGCRINVQGIEAFHADCINRNIVHPNDPLALKPWGLWEFSILDPDGNLVTFAQPAG